MYSQYSTCMLFIAHTCRISKFQIWSKPIKALTIIRYNTPVTCSESYSLASLIPRPYSQLFNVACCTWGQGYSFIHHTHTHTHTHTHVCLSGVTTNNTNVPTQLIIIITHNAHIIQAKGNKSTDSSAGLHGSLTF